MVQTELVEMQMTFHSLLKKSSGFTLVEVLMVVGLMAILAVVSISLVSTSVDETRFNETTLKLQQIREAMIGNPEVREARTRTSFGFLGDVGAIPTAAQGIAGLVTRPGGLPAFSPDATVRFGLGWNGPYLTGGAGANFTLDAWGNAIVYDPVASPPTLTSLGGDGAVGGTVFDQDIRVELPLEMISASVTGFICNSGGPFTDSAQVEFNSPDGNGGLTQTQVMVVPADKGIFNFASVPFGVRSLTIYVPSKAAPTQTLGPVVVTIDRPNFVVPCNLVDLSP